tara:strand:+ start:450 stop:1133 length:684 start_codon:yes stop_codon:yes gene_type:complete
VAIAVVVVVLFLIALGLDPTIGAVICMLTLAVIFYLITTSQPKPKPRKRRAKRKREVQASEPQFYTALPSSLGLTEIPEEPPRPQIKLPPRPIRAARRRRDFITYPVAVGGGNYSDSYVQVDKDTVLRLRSEMVPVSETKHLPGLRIDTFPSSKIAAVMSQKVTPSVVPVVAEVAAEATPVVAEPVVAEPVVVSAETPVVQSVVAQEEEEEKEEEKEEEMEFDMEWD